jgi:hypothetical protein
LPRLKAWPTVCASCLPFCGSGREVVWGDGLAGAGAFGEDGDFALHAFAAGVEDSGLEGFCGFAGFFSFYGIGGSGWAEDDAGCSVEDAADGPAAIGIREEDFAGALLFRAVIPAAEERERVAEFVEVCGGLGLGF